MVFLSNDKVSITSSRIEIFNNYPNPFNPTTSIRYYLPENSHIKVTIYDLLGSTIKNIADDFRYFGYHKHQWDATNNQGQPVSSGVYLYTIEARDFRQTKKMILLK